MPLDGHAHLVSQGWSGKGSGLRSGAIVKPINIVQKKSLAGVGKDRDEAFPFWDHVFQAASVSIQVNVHNSDDESDSEGSSTPNLALERTKTGIISNRRPTTGTPALSGATTPSDPQNLNGDGALTPRLSIMAQAKQQSARRMLYAMFYRGPVLSTDNMQEATLDSTSLAGPSSSSSPTLADKKSKEAKTKKRKVADVEREGKAEGKRRKREAKAEKRSKSKGKKASDDDGEAEEDDADVKDPNTAKAARKAERAERKKLRAEKRARKEERRNKRTARKATWSARADSAFDEEPTGIEESLSQETTPGVEGDAPPVTRDVMKTSKRTRDSSEVPSFKEKGTKKKRRKKL
ncbi:hypothetical protein V8D89_012722 [Ganoderma adspersum]